MTVVGVAQLVGVLSHKLKGYVRIGFLIRACAWVADSVPSWGT